MRVVTILEEVLVSGCALSSSDEKYKKEQLERLDKQTNKIINSGDPKRFEIRDDMIIRDSEGSRVVKCVVISRKVIFK